MRLLWRCREKRQQGQVARGRGQEGERQSYRGVVGEVVCGQPGRDIGVFLYE